MSCWIVDAGPLIFLAKLDRLNLLQRGADEVLIPVAVLNEVRALRDEATRKIEIATPHPTPNRRFDRQAEIGCQVGNVS